MVDQNKYVIKNVNNIISVDPIPFPFTQGIGPIIFENLKEAKDEVAQIDGLTGEKDTYSSFFQRCVRTAIAMRSKGIKQDDLISICSLNHLNLCVPLIAGYFLDVKVTSTDPGLSINETAILLKQIRPKMIFVNSPSVELIEAAIAQVGLNPEIVVFGETSKHTKFSDFLVESEEESTFKPVEIDDLQKTSSIFFSSGTTGLPKGICVSHKALLSTLILSKNAYKLPNTIVLTTSPLYWISFTLILLNSIFTKNCRLIVPDMTVDEMWKLIKTYKVNIMIMTPSRLAMICQRKRPDDADSSSLRMLTFGGAPFTKDQVETARKLFPTTHVFPGYGQTEVGVGTNFRPTNAEELKIALTKVMSSGQPLPGTSFKLVDIETGKTVGLNQTGEIRIKTEYQMNGYFNLDASDQWDEDGYIKTGDMGYFDDDYYLYINDRIKEMLKYQNWHIAPVLLESILLSHPAVENALVIGIPHPIDNEHPMGLVILKKDHVGAVTADEIKEFVDKQVTDRQKLRGGVKIVESFSMTPTEKYKRKHMKDLVLAGKI